MTSISGWPSFKVWLQMLETAPDPQHPLAAEEAWAREQLAKGNRAALIWLLGRFVINNELPPTWLVAEFKEAIRKVTDLEVTSWDDVFGRPLKKGQRAAAIRRKKQMAMEIWDHVNRRRRAGEAVDNEMFSRIGEQLHPRMSGSVVRQIYYDTREEAQFFHDEWLTEERPDEDLRKDSK
jgi:hypothetical protein